MSRLERYQRKKTRKGIFTIAVLLIFFFWFFLSYGIPFIINSSVSIANLFGGNRRGLDLSTPEFNAIEITDILTATNSASIRIVGTAENVDSITIHVNGVKVKTVDVEKSSTFSTIVSGLKEGTNEISVSGASTKSKEELKSESYIVQYKTNKPTLDITEPQDGYKTPRDEIKVVGKTETNQDLTIRINGLPAVTDPNGNFQALVRLSEGENKIKVTITDSAGNSEEKEIKVIYEK